MQQQRQAPPPHGRPGMVRGDKPLKIPRSRRDARTSPTLAHGAPLDRIDSFAWRARTARQGSIVEMNGSGILPITETGLQARDLGERLSKRARSRALKRAGGMQWPAAFDFAGS